MERPVKHGRKLPRKWAAANKVEDWRREELERRNSKKYHQLRFIEKQKVERKLKSCRRALEAAMASGTPEEIESLRGDLKGHLANHEYIEKYPRHLPYTSLFPKTDTEASKQRREEIRAIIREGTKRNSHALVDHENDEPDEFFEADDSGGAKIRKRQVRSSKRVDREPLSADAASPEVDGSAKRKRRAPELDAVDETRRKTKRRNVDSAMLHASVEQETVEVPRKKKKKKLKGVAEDVQTTTCSNDRKVGTEALLGKKSKPKRREELTSSLSTTTEHPSWTAKKAAKLSGVLQGSTGAKKVFDSDTE